MSDQKTLETEISRMTKRLSEIDKRYRAFQLEREMWLQKPNSPAKIERLDELAGNLRITYDDASVLQNILKDLQSEQGENVRAERKKELEEKIEEMRAIKKKMLVERDTRQEVVAKARKIISQTEDEHEVVLDSLYKINNEFKTLQNQFLVEKFGSLSQIPRNWQNELAAGLISPEELGWLR